MQTHQALTIEKVDTQVDQAVDQALIKGTDMIAGGLMTIVFTLIGAVLWLRRRISRDSLEVKRDRGEGNLLEIVIGERNNAMADARDAWAHRAKDAERIGQLTAEVHMLRILTDRQESEISSLRQEVREMRAEINAMRGKS